MKVDPLTLALALGLLGPAAVDDGGALDDGRKSAADEERELRGALDEVLVQE